MPRRKTQRPDSHMFAKDDNPIDLTGAFAPVRGPQSVDYDRDDEPLGLTDAFGAVPPSDAPDHNWPGGSKWSGFDWDGQAASGNQNDKRASAAKGKSSKRENAASIGDGAEATGALQPVSDASKKEANTSHEAKKSGKQKGSKHGRHAAAEKELSPRMKKSKRTRRVLIVLLILLLVVLGAVGYFAYQTFANSQHEAAQQTSEKVSEAPAAPDIEQTDDAQESLTRLADVPNLASLLGMTQEEAIAAIGHGAYVTGNTEVNEEGNPIKRTLNIALIEEVADSRTGTPTVYLGLGEDGRVRQAGYSASASALGFGSHSFSAAVQEDHVIEGTLEKAGVNVPVGSALLPDDVAAYTTYASDGKTVKTERCSFEGEVDVNNIPCVWSAVLSYDYTTANVTGNLSDTLRIIYVYVTMR